MSYQVLARKWRPKHFTEMVGQGHVLKALVNALDDNRLHHAYLFTGTRGVGKTSIARLFAKALNCEKGVSSKPCGQCSACVEIAEGRFVDLIEVDAASRTKVEDTRELLENVQYAPSRGRFKVYLIDEVHMLSKSSFNALLKTLEEPPPHVKFLLATTDPQKLPVTVLSRCLQFNLKNMIPLRIVEHLSSVLTAENIVFEEPALWLLARSADGSMRDALSLTDQAIAFGAGSINEADVRVMLGTIDLRLVYDLIGALIASDGAALLQKVDDLAQFSPDYHTVLGDLISLLHRIAIAQTVPSALDNSLGDKEQVIDLANQLSPEDVQLFYQIALMGRKDLPFVPDAREGIEMTLMRMLAFRPATSAHRDLSHSLVNKEASVELDQVTEQESDKHSEPDQAMETSSDEKKNREIPSVVESTENIESKESQIEDFVATNDIEQNDLQGDSGTLDRSIEIKADDSSCTIDEEVALTESEQPLSVYNDMKNNVLSGSENNESPALVVESLPKESVTSEPTKVFSPSVDASSNNVLQANAQDDIAPWEDASVNNQNHINAPVTNMHVPSEVVFKPQETLVEQTVAPDNSPIDQAQITSQINISHMLDKPVVDFARLTLEDWPALVGAIGFTGMTAHIAENLSLEAINDSSIQFNVSQVQKNVLDATQESRIQEKLSQYFNMALTVQFDSEKSTRETPWQCFEKLRAKRLRQAIDSFQSDTIVQSIVSAFSAEIDRSSIMPVDN